MVLFSCLSSCGEYWQRCTVLCGQGESCVLSCLVLWWIFTALWSLLYSIDKESLVSCLVLPCLEVNLYSTLLYSVDKESLVFCLVSWWILTALCCTLWTRRVLCLVLPCLVMTTDSTLLYSVDKESLVVDMSRLCVQEFPGRQCQFWRHVHPGCWGAGALLPWPPEPRLCGLMEHEWTQGQSQSQELYGTYAESSLNGIYCSLEICQGTFILHIYVY